MKNKLIRLAEDIVQLLFFLLTIGTLSVIYSLYGFYFLYREVKNIFLKK